MSAIMDSSGQKPESKPKINPGLCGTCASMRDVVNENGHHYFLCNLSKMDVRYPKYPKLPMVNCDGYKKI